MTGILLIAVVIAWLAVVVMTTRWISGRFKSAALKAMSSLVVFLVLLSAPFADEFFGKQQFERICNSNGIENSDVSGAKGRRVKVEYSERRSVEGTVLPTLQSDVVYRDFVTDEPLIRHKDYYSRGGWMMRYTWINMGSDHPMFFSGNGCGFGARDRRFKSEQISVVN